ncbi:MAG: outer membrane lipoprotein carrier protein LolA, partial [Sulfuriferula sp.]
MMSFPPHYLRVAVIAFICLLSSPYSHAAAWDLDQLMRNLAQTRAGHASLVETKSIAILDQPIVSSGELFYT